MDYSKVIQLLQYDALHARQICQKIKQTNSDIKLILNAAPAHPAWQLLAPSRKGDLHRDNQLL